MATEQRTLPTKPTHIQPIASAQAKLELTRVVLFVSEILECAQAALRWLATHASAVEPGHAADQLLDTLRQQLRRAHDKRIFTRRREAQQRNPKR